MSVEGATVVVPIGIIPSRWSMASMQVPCPECDSVLELPDRSLLGKKGRCPSCRHTFVLAEPEEEVQLQLADVPVDDSPRQGTSARWVPDEVAADSSGDVAPVASQAAETPPVGVGALKHRCGGPVALL